MINDYWYVGTFDGGYKVNRETYQAIKEAVRTNQKWVDFTDIFGANCGFMVKHITDWHHSTIFARKSHREFKKQLEDEEK